MHFVFVSVQMSTDCGVEGLIINIRQSPSDDSRKRLFELATANSRTYFTASQARVYTHLIFTIQLQYTGSRLCRDLRTDFVYCTQYSRRRFRSRTGSILTSFKSRASCALLGRQIELRCSDGLRSKAAVSMVAISFRLDDERF